MKCVSCEKESTTSTPDGADFCFECFGNFNAGMYDELKIKHDNAIAVLALVRNMFDHFHYAETKPEKLEHVEFLSHHISHHLLPENTEQVLEYLKDIKDVK